MFKRVGEGESGLESVTVSGSVAKRMIEGEMEQE